MAHFYGVLKGRGKPATKTGTYRSGIETNVQGYNVGIRVVCEYKNGKDVCSVYRTGGRSGYEPERLIGTFVEGGN